MEKSKDGYVEYSVREKLKEYGFSDDELWHNKDLIRFTINETLNFVKEEL